MVNNCQRCTRYGGGHTGAHVESWPKNSGKGAALAVPLPRPKVQPTMRSVAKTHHGPHGWLSVTLTCGHTVFARPPLNHGRANCVTCTLEAASKAGV